MSYFTFVARSILLATIVILSTAEEPLPPALMDQRADIVAPGGGVTERTDIEVDAVAPVVVRVGRLVDALGIPVGQPQGAVQGEPVLQGEYGQHRGRAQEFAQHTAHLIR